MESQNSITAKFKKLWIYYILQTLVAVAVLLILTLILSKEKHLVGLVSGTIFYFTNLPYFLEYPLAVGIAMFIMVALDVEHPPAAGTALAVVINEVSREAFITIMISTLVLSQCRYYLRHYLKDLM
jgi:hypothetical protein